MNTYTWAIESINVVLSLDGKSNVVCEAAWKVKATDGTYVSSAYGLTSIPYNSATVWTEYSSLLQEDVVSWVKEALTVKRCAEITAILDASIAEQATPLVATVPMPWAV